MNMNKDELNDILEKHKLWLNNEAGGERADLSGADLSGVDLSGADLRWADLSGADLSGADLRRADLRWADLSKADLSGADLRRANLNHADLNKADLSGADLSEADLSDADLSKADLRRANINYSCWPLWCGSAGVKVDRRIAAQLASHFCALDCDDEDYLAAREVILSFALTSHRANGLGLERIER